MRAPVRASVLVAVLASATLTGCGIPPDNSAREIPRALPPTATSASPTASPDAPAPTLALERLYFVKDEKLVPAERRVPTMPTVKDLLRDLVNGPTDAERQNGLRSLLQGSEVIVDVTLNSTGVAVVQLAPETVLGTSEQAYAWGQVVCTLSTLAQVTGVSFVQEGEPTAVLDGSGILQQGPLTPRDYTILLAPE